MKKISIIFVAVVFLSICATAVMAEEEVLWCEEPDSPESVIFEEGLCVLFDLGQCRIYDSSPLEKDTCCQQFAFETLDQCITMLFNDIQAICWDQACWTGICQPSVYDFCLFHHSQVIPLTCGGMASDAYNCCMTY